MGTVYFLKTKDTNLFKIGMTKGSAKKRIKELSTGSPYPLELFRTIESSAHTQLESYFHMLFDDKRAENGEFFNVHPAEIEAEIEKAVQIFAAIQGESEEVEKLHDHHSNVSAK